MLNRLSNHMAPKHYCYVTFREFKGVYDGETSQAVSSDVTFLRIIDPRSLQVVLKYYCRDANSYVGIYVGNVVSLNIKGIKTTT